MAITEKTRKLLWGRSGNRCAICKSELVIERTKNEDRYIAGEECHIISKKKEGPRYREIENKRYYDSYDNLILLCRIHHKLIDDQIAEFSEVKIRQIKTEHERWVKQNLDQGAIKPIRLRRVQGEKIEFLFRISTGKQLFDVIDSACSACTDHPEPSNESEAKLFGTFFQYVSDSADLSREFEPMNRVEAIFTLGKLIKEIEEEGFWLFGNREKQILEGGIGRPTEWYVAYLSIVRNDSPLIIDLNSNIRHEHRA